MADTEIKKRKSVSFSHGTTIMDENGNVSEAAAGSEAEDRTTAEKHSTPPVEDGVDEDPFKAKKKKSSKPKPAEDGALPETTETTGDADFDALNLKKKKKKSSKPKTTEAADDEFSAKLAKLGVDDNDEKAAPEEEVPVEEAGDFQKGTGVWAHSASTPITYTLLLDRFFNLLNQHNPDILSSGSKSYKIPPPQCLREGNKKTIFANIAEICKRMKRNDEHVTQFLFAELGTSGSVDGSKRLVIKGRFQQKQIENVLRRYIVEYVTCKTCRSPDTELSKGENRLYFVTCNSCGSRRSVTAIKSGFTAQVGKRKRMQV
jgi:translation initiation factor 2 subunit 2